MLIKVLMWGCESLVFEWDPFRKLLKRLLDELERLSRELREEDPGELDSSDLEDRGIYFYGYTIRMGPDGKPVIREFGNVNMNLEDLHKILNKHLQDHIGSVDPSLTMRLPNTLWEPLIDVFEEGDNIIVIAEAPGAKKEDIIVKLLSDRRRLLIHVKGLYRKEILLQAPADIKSSKVVFKHNVLKVILKKARHHHGKLSLQNK